MPETLFVCMQQRLKAGEQKKKLKKLGTTMQKKMNRYWSKESLIDGHKTEVARLNIYFAALQIEFLLETDPYLPLDPLAKPTFFAKQFQLYTALPRELNPTPSNFDTLAREFYLLAF